MSGDVSIQYLNKIRATIPAPEGHQRILYCDNASGHRSNFQVDQTLNHLNTLLRKLPANSTEYVQLLDSFFIKEFKRILKQEWDLEKRRLIDPNQFRPQSGKVNHPSRLWYIDLAVRCVDEVNYLFFNPHLYRKSVAYHPLIQLM